MHRLSWRYCPTSENPADIASRGIKATALKESSLWLDGPEFLSKESAYWPVQPVNLQAKEEFCELKSAKPTVFSLLNKCTRKQEANLESISQSWMLQFPYEAHKSYFTCVAICQKIEKKKEQINWSRRILPSVQASWEEVD